MMRKARHVYHPRDIGSPEDWYICHATIGALPYNEAGQPISADEILPEWYRDLSEEVLEKVDDIQNRYASDLLKWIDLLGVDKAYFDGAYEKKEATVSQLLKLNGAGFFEWNGDFINPLLTVNLKNLYLVSNRKASIIVYDSWDTIFVQELGSKLPSHLKEPYISPEILKGF